MSVPTDQTEVAAFLRGLAGADPVETHISLVFIGADTVWKLKKSVTLPFLDFAPLSAREHFCRRELALNAAASEGLYRDVQPVVRCSDGTLTIGGEGQTIDWVLRMAPVPNSDFLDAMVRQGPLPGELLDRIADAVVEYHRRLPPLQGTVPALGTVFQGNVVSAREVGLPADAVDEWVARTGRALADIDAWQRRRATEGFVRRCHGDLHLGNICLWRGAPVLFDALEFDENLARIDVAYDLAFLLMDLEHRLGRAAANRAMNRYIARTGDTDLLRGLPVFLSMRAFILAHVQQRRGNRDEAARYLRSALRYLDPPPPVALAIGGIPGTGKSTVARLVAPNIGPPPGAAILRSDEIRKRIWGVAPETPLPPDAYTASVSASVFAALAEGMTAALEAGHAAIADATFVSAAQRTLVEDAARDVPFAGFWLDAPMAVLEQRVADRRGDASDATVAVLRSFAAKRTDFGDWTRVDALDSVLASDAVRDFIDKRSDACYRRNAAPR